MYAIVETGGKQYRVEPHIEVEVEQIAREVGEEVVLDRVLMVNADGSVKVGAPYLEGAKVVCKLLAHGRGKKLEVFTYKAKKNERKKNGHRQDFTRLRVEEIVV